ncbi:hypothetical protein [Aureimonas sp. N4]|uniref:hypothetical protein n=2 Tax=unclassified Aureimonas TaxID=2615206 RepID=UPI000783B54E|nr:hypothetical protein [Aureimonas sp. N4]
MSSAYLHRPAVHVIRRSELSDIDIPPSEVVALVEDAYRSFAGGASRCPTKIMMPLPDPERDAVSHTRLGYDGAIEQVGFTTPYRQGSESAEKYDTTISLHDDTTGLPSVFWMGPA